MSAEPHTEPDLFEGLDFNEPVEKDDTPAPQASEPAEGGVQPKDARSETDRLDPAPTEQKLLSGTEFALEPLKFRQFLRLLRIVTRGAAGILDSQELDFEDQNAFAQQFLGMVLFAIPEAEEEAIEFIKSMVSLKDPTGDPKKDLVRMEDLYAELDNPELEDVVTVVQCVIETEAEDLRALGKRLSKMFETAQRVGAAPKA